MTPPDAVCALLDLVITRHEQAPAALALRDVDECSRDLLDTLLEARESLRLLADAVRGLDTPSAKELEEVRDDIASVLQGATDVLGRSGAALESGLDALAEHFGSAG